MKDLDLSALNTTSNAPKKGDTLVIETKKSKGKRLLVHVKEVIDQGGDCELILQRAGNKFFSWSMYKTGKSWVWRVWNLGDVTCTGSVSNKNKLDEF